MQKRFKINYVDLVPLIPVQVKYPNCFALPKELGLRNRIYDL